MHTRTTIGQFRRRALSPMTDEPLATMLCVPSVMIPDLHHLFGVTRDPAAEMLGSTMFQHDVVTISVSAHDLDNQRQEPYLAEVFACFDRLFGKDFPFLVRQTARPVSNSSLLYFKALVDGEHFYAPSPLQDAYLTRKFDAWKLEPAGV